MNKGQNLGKGVAVVENSGRTYDGMRKRDIRAVEFWASLAAPRIVKSEIGLQNRLLLTGFCTVFGYKMTGFCLARNDKMMYDMVKIGRILAWR